MDGWNAFKPQNGPTRMQTQSSTGASSPVMCSTRVGGDISYLIFNQSNGSNVFVGYGPNSGAAAANAVVPAAGVPPTQQTLMVPAGTLQTWTLNPNLFFSAIMDPQSGQDSTANVLVQPGDGV